MTHEKLCRGLDYLTALRRMVRAPTLRAALPEWPADIVLRVVEPHLPPCTSIDQRSQMESYVAVVVRGVASPYVPTMQDTLREDWMLHETGECQ